jgi:hypothetical protein
MLTRPGKTVSCECIQLVWEALNSEEDIASLKSGCRFLIEAKRAARLCSYYVGVSAWIHLLEKAWNSSDLEFREIVDDLLGNLGRVFYVIINS